MADKDPKKDERLLELLARRQEERKQRETDIQKLVGQKLLAEETIKRLARKRAKSQDQDKAIEGLLTNFIMGGLTGKTKSLKIRMGPKTGVSELYVTSKRAEVLLAVRTEENYGSPVFMVADLKGRAEDNIKRGFVKLLRQYFKAYVLCPLDLLWMWLQR